MDVAKPKNDPHTKSQWHEEMTDGKPFAALWLRVRITMEDCVLNREKVNIRKKLNINFKYFTPPVLILFNSSSFKFFNITYNG